MSPELQGELLRGLFIGLALVAMFAGGFAIAEIDEVSPKDEEPDD